MQAFFEQLLKILLGQAFDKKELRPRLIRSNSSSTRTFQLRNSSSQSTMEWSKLSRKESNLDQGLENPDKANFIDNIITFHLQTRPLDSSQYLQQTSTKK